MKNLSIVAGLIKIVWAEPLLSELTSKKLDVSLYPGLRKAIPDKFIFIEEVFPEADLGEIWRGYEDYLGKDRIFPFLGTMGDAVLCIGYGEENKGKMFYFDFDFGIIALSDDRLEDFLGKLVDAA